MGVPKQMPDIGAKSAHQHVHTRGIQSYRNVERYTPMNDVLKAPFPWPGGKSDMAGAVWARFGVVENYCEPFSGSAAMLLARPGGAHGTETVNDLDGLLINAYRAVTFAPDETAEWCDWPVSEADLTSRHLWLKAQRDELTARLFGDPLYCDPQAAGWWLWGIASWIGDGWCVSDGPWISVDGRLVDRRKEQVDQEGVPSQMPNVGGGGARAGYYTATHGIESVRRAPGVPRKMPEVGRSPNGQMNFNRKGVQAVRYGVPKQMPQIQAKSAHQKEHNTGIQAQRREDSALSQYFTRLSDRLRRVRFLCGDWQRACKDSVTVNHGLTAVFLDPPYPTEEHDMRYHGENDAWHAAAQWAIERGDDPRLRIAICGYHTEEIDRLFPSNWERLRWEARGGYANQKADGRGRANAKREIIWFSPNCLDVAAEARAAFDKPITVRESDYTGTMFEELT